MKKRIYAFVLIGILLFGLLTGCQQEQADMSQNGAEEIENPYGWTIEKVDDTEESSTESYDTSRAYYEDYDDTGLETYIIANIFNETEEYICDIRELGYCQYIFENEDGKIEVKMTEEQKEAWIEKAVDNIEEVLAGLTEEELYQFEFNEDYTVLKAVLNKKCDASTFFSDLLVLLSNAEIYQIFTGTEEWSVNIIVENMDTGNELSNVQFPQEGWEITPEMWDE